MKQYIKPEICVCSFDASDIITDSAISQPQDVSGYTPAEGSPSFADTAYVTNWNIMN